MKNKVAKVTFVFWIIKIAATTLGETAGDMLSMTYKVGYAVSTGIFFAIFAAAVAAQIAVTRYYPFLYWLVIVTTTTVGTTMSDYLTRTAGLGYLWSSLLLFAMVMIVLIIWKVTTGSISVQRIADRKSEAFYWLAILFSNTLGTALGDCVSDAPGMSYAGGSLVFGGALLVIGVLYFFSKISHTSLFWAAFILTRPLGATLGDMLTKEKEQGGLELSRVTSSLLIAVFMVIMVFFFSRRPKQADAPIDHDAPPAAPVA